MTTRICPTSDELAAFSVGNLPPAELETVAGHLEGCSRCQSALRSLDDLTDPVLASLRRIEAPAETATRTGDVVSLEELPAPRRIGHYELEAELGRGGMGVVYKARDVRLGRTVALKMILGGQLAGMERRERFRREAEAVARVQHPDIVRLYEVGEHEGLPYFTLEYVEGGSLEDRLRGLPQPPRQAAEWVAGLAWALDHAHRQGVIHRQRQAGEGVQERR